MIKSEKALEQKIHAFLGRKQLQYPELVAAGTGLEEKFQLQPRKVRASYQEFNFGLQ